MKRFSLFFASVLLSGSLFAQTTTEVNYSILQDEPEKINKLFIGFQPFYGELWASNPTAGFGLDAAYYHEDKLDLSLKLRRPYSSGFDIMKSGADANSSMDNEYKTHFHIELGGSYHFKDEISEKESSMVLYKKNTKKTKWEAQVPPTVTVPSKLRTIYAARMGGMFFNTTVDVNRFIERQGLEYADIISGEGSPIPTEFENELGDIEQVNMFTNMSVGGIYLGGSVTLARNISLEFDNYEPNIEDMIFTMYFDLLIALGGSPDDLFYQDQVYSLDPLKLAPIGGRLGIDGKRNRKIGMGFGAEIGYKPGLKMGGFFGLVKVSLPVFSSNLDENLIKAYEAN